MPGTNPPPARHPDRPGAAAPAWSRERKIYLAVGIVILLFALVLLILSL